jgi:hypothetical protein
MNVQELGWGSTDWIDLAQDGCKCGNETSGSIKCREFYDWQRTCLLLRKETAPWRYGNQNSEIYYNCIIEVFPLINIPSKDTC